MKPALKILFSIAFLGLFGWGMVELIIAYVFLLKTLDKQVAAAIIAASTTVIVSVASLILAKYYENKRLIEKDIRDKKILIYEKLMKQFFLYMGTKDKSKVQNLDAFYLEFAPGFLTWGSDEVIQHWSEFRRIATNNEGAKILDSFERLVLIIRKDVGHKNIGIDKNKVLLSAFINDLDTLYPKTSFKK